MMGFSGARWPSCCYCRRPSDISRETTECEWIFDKDGIPDSIFSFDLQPVYLCLDCAMAEAEENGHPITAEEREIIVALRSDPTSASYRGKRYPDPGENTRD